MMPVSVFSSSALSLVFSAVNFWFSEEAINKWKNTHHTCEKGIIMPPLCINSPIETVSKVNDGFFSYFSPKKNKKNPKRDSRRIKNNIDQSIFSFFYDLFKTFDRGRIFFYFLAGWSLLDF